MSNSDTIPLHVSSSQSDIDEIETLIHSGPTTVLPSRPQPPSPFIPSNLPPPQQNYQKAPPRPPPTVPVASADPTPNPNPIRSGTGSDAFGSGPNTLTEPVWETVKRDLARIINNLKLVVFPNPFREDPGKALRDWDLWGPFFFIVFLGLTLSWSASVKKVEFFRMKVGVFGSDKTNLALKQFNPAEWWSIIARETTSNLTRLAMRVLSQTVLFSICERNWTIFTLIHTKTRNRLTTNNLKRLVYVHYNMRLRERNIKRKNYDDKTIDLDQIFHEDDLLAEWTCEVENRLLDDIDNSWLDEEISEATVLDAGRRSHRSDKRKKAVISEGNEDSDSPDEHGGGGSIDGGGVSGVVLGGGVGVVLGVVVVMFLMVMMFLVVVDVLVVKLIRFISVDMEEIIIHFEGE